MIIYTNDGNPFGLQLQICGKLGGKADIPVEVVDLNDKRINELKHLPILELDSGAQVFSSNAAALYLFPVPDRTNQSITNSCHQWLEWSQLRLVPILQQRLNSKTAAAATESFGQHIKLLELSLKTNSYLTGATLTAADIGIWTLLNITDVQKQITDYDAIESWIKRISDLPEVKSSLDVTPLSKLSLASIQQSNKFGGIPQASAISSTIGIGGTELKISPTESPNPDILSDNELVAAKSHFVLLQTFLTPPAKVVLPVKDKRNIMITSALPYVNNVPHLGNIIGCVLSADIFARYARCAGYNTILMGGTDEYGTATETKALAENTTPKQICDKYFKIHDEIYKWFNISFDHFGRTTSPEQTKIVQKLFNDLLKKNLLDIETVDQLLCEKCNRYLADRFVEGTCPHPGCGYEDARGDQCDGCSKLVNAIELIKPRCNVCRTTPVVRQSNQFFINLPKIEPKLRAWLETSDSTWSHNARVITKAWLKEGLRPRCITRDLKWGIPVPYKGFESKVFYVWFDATIGYMSITNTYTDRWLEWWQPTDKKVELFQFMAKDNVPFHSVMFPSTLLGVDDGYTTVSSIMATEYLNYEDGKFSKSRGTGVFGNDARDTGIPADVWRFYLASARPEGQDSNFSWNELVTRNNSELLNNLGNFINRSLVFCEKSFNGTIPPLTLGDDELTLVALVNRDIDGYVQSMEKAKFRDGLRHILSISRHGNQYMQSQQPWVLLKGTDDQKAKAGHVIGLSCNMVCLLASLLEPFMPDTSKVIYEQLNTQPRTVHPSEPFMEQYLETGHKIGKPAPLFAKIEQSKLDEMKKKFGSAQQTPAAANDGKRPEPSKVLATVADAERAVAEQGEKVRAAKASGAEKSIWQPEVAILLNLKKQLAALQATEKENKPIQALINNSVPVSREHLEAKITKQGEKVRNLKASGDKSVWQPEVAVLLDLKKQLSALSPATPATTNTEAEQRATTEKLIEAPSSQAQLEEKIAKQAEKVRQLKGSTEKSVWQPEVNVLLALKKELAAIVSNGVQPVVAAAPSTGSKGGKNKKKK